MYLVASSIPRKWNKWSIWSPYIRWTYCICIFPITKAGRIEIKKYPELAEIGGQLPNNGRKGGYYTQEEFKDLVNYAKERFITIIPEVDIPGHTAAIFAAYPDFKNAVKFKTNVNIPGQAFNALDVDDPKAMQFTEDVIAELAALAPGNYIHIGGDEAIGLPHDKFVRFINKTREIVLKNGKKMVGWQETPCR